MVDIKKTVSTKTTYRTDKIEVARMDEMFFSILKIAGTLPPMQITLPEALDLFDLLKAALRVSEESSVKESK